MAGNGLPCDRHPRQDLGRRNVLRGLTAVSSVEHYPRGYAPKGQTPVLVLSQSKRERINLISAVTNRGAKRFMIYRENMTSEILIRFMQRLIKDAGRKVFLVLDNLRVHYSKVVQAWLEGHRDQIGVFFLPSYSPELNLLVSSTKR